MRLTLPFNTDEAQLEHNQKNTPLTPAEIARQFFPHGVPFPLERLARAIPQVVGHRKQWIDPSGSFVATPIASLPRGGEQEHHLIKNTDFCAFLIADMGMQSEQQQAVFRTVKADMLQTRTRAQSLLIGNGDWAYPHGPIEHSAQELERMQETILNQAAALTKQAPFLAVLGNHEYGDHVGPADPAIFMDMARASGLTIPARYYAYAVEHRDWAVDFIALDTTTVAMDYAQQVWLKRMLDQSMDQENQSNKPRWRIVVAHHPFLSYGMHDDRNDYLQELLSESLGKVDLYLGGHEHDIQYLSPTGQQPPLLICGTSSHSRDVAQGSRTRFRSSAPGYARLWFSPKNLAIEVMSVNVETNTPTHFQQPNAIFKTQLTHPRAQGRNTSD